jgi:hypothetical protein
MVYATLMFQIFGGRFPPQSAPFVNSSGASLASLVDAHTARQAKWGVCRVAKSGQENGQVTDCIRYINVNLRGSRQSDSNRRPADYKLCRLLDSNLDVLIFRQQFRVVLLDHAHIVAEPLRDLENTSSFRGEQRSECVTHNMRCNPFQSL